MLKSRDITLPTKVHVVKAVVLYQCSGMVWKLDCKEGGVSDNWCLQTVVLKKTPESPLDSKEIRPVNFKRNQSWIFFGKTDAEAETQYFGHLMWTADSLEKSLLLGKIEGRRRRKVRGRDSSYLTTNPGTPASGATRNWRVNGEVSPRAFGGKMALLTPYFGLSASRTLTE